MQLELQVQQACKVYKVLLEPQVLLEQTERMEQMVLLEQQEQLV